MIIIEFLNIKNKDYVRIYSSDRKYIQKDNKLYIGLTIPIEEFNEDDYIETNKKF